MIYFINAFEYNASTILLLFQIVAIAIAVWGYLGVIFNLILRLPVKQRLTSFFPTLTCLFLVDAVLSLALNVVPVISLVTLLMAWILSIFISAQKRMALEGFNEDEDEEVLKERVANYKTLEQNTFNMTIAFHMLAIGRFLVIAWDLWVWFNASELYYLEPLRFLA